MSEKGLAMAAFNDFVDTISWSLLIGSAVRILVIAWAAARLLRTGLPRFDNNLVQRSLSRALLS